MVNTASIEDAIMSISQLGDFNSFTLDPCLLSLRHTHSDAAQSWVSLISVDFRRFRKVTTENGFDVLLKSELLNDLLGQCRV